MAQQESNQARGDVRDVAPPVRYQQLLLLELLDPPHFGGSIAKFARRLDTSVKEIEAAAAALEAKGLAEPQDEDGYVAASGPAMCFDELWPIAL